MAEIDFDAEGLLEGLRGRPREARLELLRELAADGVPIEELRRAVEQDRLALLPVERVLGGSGPGYSAREVGELTGLDAEVLLRLREAFGMPVGSADAPELTDEDLEAARRLKRFLDAGVPEEGIFEVSRVIGMAMAQIADANRTLIGDTFWREGDTERDLGHRYADVARTLLPLVRDSLEYPYRLHLRDAIRSSFVTEAELESGRPAASQDITVAFADLVGFTRLGERLDAGEIGAVSGRLNELARSVANPPVRLVKTIGDAAMLVSTDTDALLSTLLSLVERAEEDELLPAMRAGAARGPAQNRGGDWYGRPVNLASRITAAARPGTVLAAADVSAHTQDGFRFSKAGRRRFKGIKGEVSLRRVRREAEPAGPSG